ncbi:hypothetical protein [Bradyrhizobium sp. th.b2]|uniref:hypothetical protein n=1 Tax=Bradyrhizobium sp. th-b2 TaxID=172088 RepID=UPI001FDAB688|nr:hypothetical protein [Bradyrhizobium sp. th.b2]
MVEILKSTFENELEEFYGDDIGHIATHPQRYSDPISPFRFGRKAGSEQARYFSYQLGNKSVGLLRTEPGGLMSELFKGDNRGGRSSPDEVKSRQG